MQSNTSPMVELSHETTNNGPTIRSPQETEGDGKARNVASKPESADLPISASSDKDLCFKHTAGEDQNQYVRIAAEISNNDKEFLAKLDSENSLWKIDRQSNVVINGIREPSFGFCQTHRGYHPEIVNDKRFFTDAKWQLEQCYKLFKGGTKMYARTNITIKNFTCPQTE